MNRYKSLYQGALIQIDDIVSRLNNGNFNPASISDFSTKAYSNMLSNRDLVLCSNRYKWTGLSEITNLTSQELESMFYRFGSLCFFMNEEKQLIVSRYAVVGKLNPFGKLDKIQPIDFSGKSHKVVKNVIGTNGQQVDSKDPCAVIINDYTCDYMNILEQPRASINAGSTITEQLRTYKMLANYVTVSVKKALALCENEEQKNVVTKQVAALLAPDNIIVPIVSKGKGKSALSDTGLELFKLDDNFSPSNYCQLLDYYDKVRRLFNGIPSPDTFEKRERKITGETEDASIHSDIMLYDGLMTRQYGLKLMQKYLPFSKLNNVRVEISDPLIQDTETETDTEPKEVLKNE